MLQGRQKMMADDWDGFDKQVGRAGKQPGKLMHVSEH